MPKTQEQVELAQNAAGRMVPAVVNGHAQVPYLGVGKYGPNGRKGAPPVRSSRDYRKDGDKRVVDLETALQTARIAQGILHDMGRRMSTKTAQYAAGQVAQMPN